jgi:hypothetical protein
MTTMPRNLEVVFEHGGKVYTHRYPIDYSFRIDSRSVDIMRPVKPDPAVDQPEQRQPTKTLAAFYPIERIICVRAAADADSPNEPDA